MARRRLPFRPRSLPFRPRSLSFRPSAVSLRWPLRRKSQPRASSLPRLDTDSSVPVAVWSGPEGGPSEEAKTQILAAEATVKARLFHTDQDASEGANNNNNNNNRPAADTPQPILPPPAHRVPPTPAPSSPHESGESEASEAASDFSDADEIHAMVQQAANNLLAAVMEEVLTESLLKRSRAQVGRKGSVCSVRERHGIDDYCVVRQLGFGGYSTVELAQHLQTGQLVAIKVMSKYELVKREHEKYAIQEKRILRAMTDNTPHPSIVQYRGSFQDDVNVYLAMEFVEGMSFRRVHCSRAMPEVFVKFFVASLIDIVDHMHTNNVLFRDLKPDNVVLDKQGYLKLVDFGLARHLSHSDSEDGRAHSVCGTPEYFAPEILLKAGYGYSVEWWALGIVMYELLVGTTPFAARTPVEIYHNILRTKPRYPVHISSPAKSLLRKLLKKHPENRIGCQEGGADDVRAHEWFEGFDWERLRSRKLVSPAIFLNLMSDNPQKRTKADAVEASRAFQARLRQALPLPDEDNELFAGF